MLTKDALLKQYKTEIKRIRTRAKEAGLSETRIDIIYKKSLDKLKSDGALYTQRIPNTVIHLFLLLIGFSVFIYILLNVHQPTSSIVLRNVQGLTYPALKTVRALSVPVIKVYNRLTDLYDESCLIQNPYFYVTDMECWPCQTVHSVIDLTNVNSVIDYKKVGDGTPFIAKTQKDKIELKDLQILYQKYSKEVESDSQRIKSNSPDIKEISSLFNKDSLSLSPELHIQWRVNKMSTGRVLRQLFKRPYFIPDRSGQSVERFLIVDDSKAKPYELPNTECNHVLLIQGSGERTIVLKTSSECSTRCKTVSVVLKPSYALMYNWWYWRPISLPTENSSTPSITYISSYC